MNTSQKQHAVAAAAAEMDTGEWLNWIEERQRSTDRIIETVKGEVSNGVLEPLTATRMVACITGSAFGYEEFHPRGEQLPAEQQLDLQRTLDQRVTASGR